MKFFVAAIASVAVAAVTYADAAVLEGDADTMALSWTPTTEGKNHAYTWALRSGEDEPAEGATAEFEGTMWFQFGTANNNDGSWTSVAD